ncbi:DUF3823 domain-containing protein [Mucilaginibacter sp.]|uniref:DUF3823 domain-containing protein n=1 Tax=Mucilaginibacter sp. TaxID=1882438 RepID=UPI0026030B96|nr:DUF3823 domain-containing protein [Mucilaginibacter sp.]MDB5030146.1 hypothetical protein [Mucilaginibacter sp.]
MRTIKLIYIIPCLLLALSACQKDNYPAPDATISGTFLDAETGGQMELKQNGTDAGSIRFIVNDPAKYPAPSALDYVLKQDGTFYNSLVFSENYRVLPLPGSGPWVYTGNGVVPTAASPGGKPDTLNVTVAPKTTTVIPTYKVYPYFHLTLTMVDTLATITITRSLQATLANNNLTNANNLCLYVNNYPLVNGNVSQKTGTAYYVNRWNFSINNTVPTTQVWGPAQSTQYYAFGTPITLPINNILKADGTVNIYGVKWAGTHWAKGTYYFRASIVGAGSTNSKENYSNTTTTVIH